MSLKLWHLALMVFLILPISGVMGDENIIIGQYTPPAGAPTLGQNTPGNTAPAPLQIQRSNMIQAGGGGGQVITAQIDPKTGKIVSAWSQIIVKGSAGAEASTGYRMGFSNAPPTGSAAIGLSLPLKPSVGVEVGTQGVEVTVLGIVASTDGSIGTRIGVGVEVGPYATGTSPPVPIKDLNTIPDKGIIESLGSSLIQKPPLPTDMAKEQGSRTDLVQKVSPLGDNASPG